MHDNRGRPLKAGDRILIPFVIESTSPGEDYCNITARSVFGRKPDGLKECFSGNASVVLRSNDGDDCVEPFTQDT